MFLHPSFSSFVNVVISFKPSQPSLFFISETFSSLVSFYVFVSRMFVTTISKFNNSRDLSCTFKLNEGFSRASPPCLFLCGSLGLAVGASQGPASASLSTIVTAVTNWMAILSAF